VHLPARAVRNDDVLARVRARFHGTDAEWDRVERRIRSLFRACGTELRYLEEEAPTPLAGHAARVGARLLEGLGVAPAELDLVIYGSIAREYYEPATAAEVAGRLGADRALAYDVTAACAGSLVAIQDVVARAAVDDAIRRALVVTATMTAGHIRYDIPDADAVTFLGAGLTLGNAATAVAITREPGPGRGRVVAMLAESMSKHHDLCHAPINGHFVTNGPEIFALARHLPDHVRALCARAGWRPDEVATYVCHQPSNAVLRGIAAGLELPADRLPQLHGVYGNCAASSVPLALRHLVDAGRIRPGDKLVLAAAASGFIMASLALIWED
jgi:3-oxoacyl-[acyl-carrier-protein] synthase-3